ncbi:MAG: hypothetical protein U0872_00745 [Planctomycetaceae bacterium]
MSSVPVSRPESTIAVPGQVTEKISRVVQKTRESRLISGAILAAAGALLILLAAILIDWTLVLFETEQRRGLTLFGLLATGGLGIGLIAFAWMRRMTLFEAARQIDRQIPELEERWTSVLDFAFSASAPELRGAESLRRKVAEEAAQLSSRVDPVRIPSKRELTVAASALGLVVGFWLLALIVDARHVGVLVQRFFSPAAEISLTRIHSETGDVVLPKGADVRLVASVQGRRQKTAELFVQYEGQKPEAYSLKVSAGESPQAEFPMKNLQSSFAYRFRSGDGQTPWRRVTIADKPVFRNIRLKVTPPSYSKLPETAFDSLPKTILALADSRLELTLEPNQPLKSLAIQRNQEPPENLPQQDSGLYRWELLLTDSLSIRPLMETPEGLRNEPAPHCEITVFRDQAPTVSIADPTADVAIRPDDQLNIIFDAKDDLGISQAELVVFDASSPDGKELRTIPIPLGDQAGERTIHAQIELNLEEFDLKQGDALTYAIRVYDTKQEAVTQQPVAAADPESNDSASAAEQNIAQASDAPADSQPADSKPSQESAADSQSPSANGQNPAEDRQNDKDEQVAAQSKERKDNQSSKEQAGGGNRWTPKSSGEPSDDKKPAGEMLGKPRPDFLMAKRELDTPAGQCSSCMPRKITIDEWAGSYNSQVLEKLQLEIDPVLTQLKETLLLAQKTLTPVVTRMRSGAGWNQTCGVDVRATDESLQLADRNVKDLTAKSQDTPYAFIGLQLQDISQLHVLPARQRLSEVTLFDSPANTEDLTASLVHIQRALELLEKLTQKYEAVKLNQQLSDTMTRVKKMHQIFLEETFALLKSQKPTLNPKQRTFMELELSDEYLEKLQALLKKKLEIQGELAKVLSKDPRLLQRYMARSRLEATSLRDQLTLLNQRQVALRDDVADYQAAGGKSDEKSHARQVAQRVAAADHIAEQAATMLDNFVVWIPRDLDLEEEALSKQKMKAVEIVASAAELAKASRQDDAKSSLDAARRCYEQVKNFQQSLPDLLEECDHPKLPSHVANRLEELGTLVTDLTGWIRKEELHAAGQWHLATEVDQHRITVDAETLTRKLTSLRAQCQGISAELGEKADEFLSTMERELVPELELSQISLSDNEIAPAVEHQTESIVLFDRAEKELDAVMDGIIAHLDSQPFNKTPQIADDAMPPSLEELLAMLEEEARAAEGLGIPCCRPSNLIVEKDWSMPGASAAGSGSGSGNGNGQGTGGSQRTVSRYSFQPRAQMNQAKRASELADKIRQESKAAMSKSMQRGDAEIKPGGPRRTERAWDTLGSQLERHVRKERGQLAPEQYRQAIERYFETLAGQKRSDEPGEK